jgi:hypothetical protein
VVAQTPRRRESRDPRSKVTWSSELWGMISGRFAVGQRFSIEDIYAWEEYLAEKHPNNRHIRETCRDKLQEFRDLDLIEFVDDEGVYRRIA